MNDTKRYMMLQKLELDEHKYFLSEQRGYDVGNGETVGDWINSGHAERFQQLYREHRTELDIACRNLCGPEGCDDDLRECNLGTKRLHKILEDF